MPETSLPDEASAWRRTHAVNGRIVVERHLPSSIASKLGALFDLGEPYKPPRIISCIVDATRHGAYKAMQCADSDSEAVDDDGEEGEEDDDDENDVDEENPRWDS